MHQATLKNIVGYEFTDPVQEASSLSRIVVALPRLLEAACLTSGHFTPGEAQTVANLVLEHGQVYAVTELSLALKALAVHAADRLTGPRFRTLVRLIIIHGDLELAKVRVLGSCCSIQSL